MAPRAGTKPVNTAIYRHATGQRELAIQWICPWLPLGSHFLRHLLNGVVLYLTTCAYLLNQPPRR